MTTSIEPNCDPLPLVEYGDIDAPGAYVLHDTGLLLRVPPEEVAWGHSPPIPSGNPHPVLASRLSEDPWIPVDQARGIAESHHLPVSF